MSLSISSPQQQVLRYIEEFRPRYRFHERPNWLKTKSKWEGIGLSGFGERQRFPWGEALGLDDSLLLNDAVKIMGSRSIET